MGKRQIIYCLLVICLGFLFTACEKNEDYIVIDTKTYSVQQSRLKYWLEYLCSSECEGRKSGTVGNERAREYIVSELKRMSYAPLMQEAVDEQKRTYYNIIVQVGGDKSRPTIVIGAHYDGAVESSKYPAANDNASGVASLLLLAHMLADSDIDFPYNYQLVFFDGEETQTGGTSFNGSRFFVSALEEPPLFYLNIDMIGNAEMLHRIETTSDYLAGCVLEIGERYKRLELEVDNRIVKYSQDFVPFDAVDIPVFTWKNPLNSDQGKYNHTPEDKLKYLSLEKMEIITNINFELITYPFTEDIYKNNRNATD